MQEATDQRSESDPPQQRRFDDACEAFADILLEAIEATFEESGGKRLHPELAPKGDLIAMLNRGTTDPKELKH